MSHFRKSLAEAPYTAWRMREGLEEISHVGSQCELDGSPAYGSGIIPVLLHDTRWNVADPFPGSLLAHVRRLKEIK